MSEVKFDSPAKRIIREFEPKNKFGIDPTLPDLGFLRQLSIQGRLRYFNSGEFTTDGDKITITPSEGETFFMYSISTFSFGNIDYTLTNDEQERPFFSAIGTSNSVVFTLQMMDSLVGNNIKSIILNANVSGVSQGSATILGWVENTSRIRDVTT